MGVRSNHFGRKMAVASALMHDLADIAQRWDYSDARLTAPRAIVTSMPLIEIKFPARLTYIPSRSHSGVRTGRI